nr:reverse transcriptase domain-containing protein [Tanacetum cinerariifolium]
MSTCSSARNLFPPFDSPELTIRRRSRSDPTLLNDFEMATEGNSDPPVLDIRTMEELCQPSLNGRGGPIALIAIQAMNFGLKNDMIQQVHNSSQFHGLSGDDANKHLDRFLHVTQSIKVNGVTDDALRMYLFPHSLTHHATAWFDCLPRNSINTFEQMAKMFLGKDFPPSMVTKLRNEITNFRQRPDESLFEAWERGTFMKRRPEECYDLIKNMTAHHNDWDTSAQRNESSSSITSFSDLETVALKAEMEEINKNLIKVLQINHQVKAVTLNCETCGGPHSYNDCPDTVIQTHNVYAARAYQCGNSYQPQGASHGQNPPPAYQAPVYQTLGYQALVHQPPIPQPQVVTTTEFTNYMKANDAILKNMQTNMTSLTNSNLELKNMFGQFMKMNTASSSGSGTLPSNTITNPKEDLKGITIRSGNAYQGPMIPTTSSSLPEVVERDRVVDFDVDPRVPLIFGRSFLKIRKALIDVYEGELTLRVGKEAITFNLDQTSRYSAYYIDMTANQIDVIDMACEEYSEEVLSFSDVIASGNPITYYDPIVSTSSPTLTPFGDSDFLLEKVNAFLALEDDPTSPKVDQSYLDTEGDILLLEAFLNDDPSLPPPTQGKYLPQIQKELKIYEAKNDKSSTDEPPEVELKDLPPHLKYIFLEGDDKLPVMIAKDLSVEEKSALIKVLKSHKKAIAWKLSDIKGINPEFCTHKILIEDDFEPAVQHQRRESVFYSKNGIEVDKAKVDVVAKLPHPTIVKGIRSFLGHAGFYRRFIQDFSKIAQLMTRLLKKDTLFFFSNERIEAFQTLKRKLTEAPILIAPDWDLPFELMCDSSNFAISFKTPIGCTSYKLVYEKACHLPIELDHKAYRALKHANFDLQTAEKTKRLHDSKIKDRVFNIGDPVLLFNSRLNIFSGKLKTRWSGPFTITHVFPYETVELSQTDWPNFKVNGHRLKHYFGEDIPMMVVLDLQTFPKDQ